MTPHLRKFPAIFLPLEDFGEARGLYFFSIKPHALISLFQIKEEI
jgi:hypothetical protein